MSRGVTTSVPSTSARRSEIEPNLATISLLEAASKHRHEGHTCAFATHRSSETLFARIFLRQVLCEEIAERAELRFAFHLLPVLLIRVAFGVLLKRLHRELHLAAARIDLDDFGFHLRTDRKRLAK